jgi:hypothetical protein
MAQRIPFEFERAAAMQHLDFHKDGEKPINDDHKVILEWFGTLIERIDVFGKTIPAGPNKHLIDCAQMGLVRAYRDAASVRLPERNGKENYRDTGTDPESQKC